MSKMPFSYMLRTIWRFLALLDTLRSALTSSIVNSSVCITRSSTDEAKLTEEATSCVSGGINVAIICENGTSRFILIHSSPMTR
ncbi:hypothetical protein D3C86_2002290 [compost metagenome]